MATATLTIEDIVKKTAELPTIPAAALAVMRESESATGTARSISQHLSCDQALSARVLRLANSAYYGLPKQVTDLSEAVVLLGMRSVRNLAVVAATYPWMQKPLSGYALEPKALWSHSFAVAVGSQLIARRTGACDSDLAFTAGLLHNIGKVAMSVWLDRKLAAVLGLAQRDRLAFDEVERKLLGFDHAEVGAYLAEMWNLPASLTQPIRYHHNPNALEPANPVVDTIHLADFLTISMGYGLGGDGLRYNFSHEVMERLSVSASDLDGLVNDFMDAYLVHEKVIEEMTQAA